MNRISFVSAVITAVSVVACGSGVDLECGPGTVESDGQCLPTAAPSTGGAGGEAGSGGSSATGGSAGAAGGAGGSSATGGSGGTSATGGAGGSGGNAGSGGSGGSDCVPQEGGYLVTLTVRLSENQLPAIVKHDLPGSGWDVNAVDCNESPCVIKVVATSGLHRFNAELGEDGWLVRGDIELGMLSVPTSDLEARVNCSDLPAIQRLAAGQTTIPPFSVWYGRERNSGDGQAFICLGTTECAIDAR